MGNSYEHMGSVYAHMGKRNSCMIKYGMLGFILAMWVVCIVIVIGLSMRDMGRNMIIDEIKKYGCEEVIKGYKHD